jgi:asparagine synthase (glutamine-hydrolysing)
MCGIAGLWAPLIGASERQSLVEGMLNRLAHRGPDGAAIWSGDGITLGLARLAIVAPDHPVSVSANATGTIAAVANGEIYNHREIRETLAAKGHPMGSGPDTAALPSLYEELGMDFPAHLDGMFAIAIWDGRRERLVLARDRAGEKPLFIAAMPGRFAFASEPAALLGLPWIPRDPSPAAIARYLAHGFFAGGDCAFAAIRQIPPGHVLEVGADGERQTRYWRPWDGLLATTLPPREDRAIINETRRALEVAVESRLPSDVPFGVFLSGGLDSSLVAALAARARGRFPTFSLRIPGRGYDESAFARAVALRIGSEHHELEIDDQDGEELLHRISESTDQPLGDPSLLPTWALSRFASRHVRVVLTGEGGDELFAGYPTYLGHRLARLANRIPQRMASVLRSLAHRLEPADTHISPAHLVESLLSVRDLPPLDRHLEWFGAASPREVLSLLSPALRRAVAPGDPRAHLTALERVLEGIGRSGEADPDLVVYQLMDFELYLSGGLLTKVDRATMAHGLEARAPFLHYPLVEFAMALPERAKLRGMSGKWALKKAAHGLLPDSIVKRRKQGFSPPFSSWARGPLKRLILSKLDPQRVSRTGILDPAAVVRIVGQHLAREAERGRTIWTLLSLQMWAERWVEGTGPPPIQSDAPAEWGAGSLSGAALEFPRSGR